MLNVEKFPQAIGDFRKILDDSDVDALICAAPNHWHAPATILGCAAGKHVYVEKPCSHNPREGELMVEAARKHNRAVQMGSQRRSGPGTIDAMKKLHAGAIGRVYLVRSWYNSARATIGVDRGALHGTENTWGMRVVSSADRIQKFAMDHRHTTVPTDLHGCVGNGGA